MDTERLPFVQGMRGVAVLAVVLYHARVFISGPSYLDLGPRLFDSGAAGVDLFFILSGFIMVHTARRAPTGSAACIGFWARRFARIWPVYAVAFVGMWAVTRGLANPAFHPTWRATAYTFSFYPTDPGGAAPFFGYPLLHPGWSLNYEVLFYALFGAALLFGRWRYLVLAAAFAVCLIVLPFALTGDVHLDATRSYGLRGYNCLLTSPLVWEFLAGVAIGLLYHAHWQCRDRGLAASVVALSVTAVLWQFLSGYSSGHGLTGWGLPLTIMFLAVSQYDKAWRIAVPRWLTWLGDVSFSLYLWHVIPQMLQRQFPTSPLMKGGGIFVGSILCGCVLAYLSHRWLEQGLSTWVRRRLLAGLARVKLVPARA